MEQFQNATDFSLKSVIIAALGEEDDGYEIKQMVGTFAYVESISSPFVVATMSVADSAGLLAGLPIQGGETVKVTVATSIKNEPDEYVLRVWKIGNRFAKNNVQAFTVGLVSAEAFNNECTKIYKPLTGKGDAIVADILQNSLKTEKEFFSETTEFEQKFLPSSTRPFDIINTIAGKSVPAGAVGSQSSKKSKNEKEKLNGTAGFLFWETKRGYNYFSVDYLLNPEDVWGPYVEKISNQSDGADERFTISQATFQSDVDIMKSLRLGKYSSLLVFFNHSTGQYDEYHYSLEDAYENMKHLGAQNTPSIIPISDDRLISDVPTKIVTQMLDHETWYNEPAIGSYEENDGSESPSPYCDFHKHFAAQSLMRYELLTQQQATVVIPGNSEICAGDCIEIKLVNKHTGKIISEEPWDQESSGVYLVGEVTHTFDSTRSTNGRFVTTLRLLRDSSGFVESSHGTK